MAGVQKDAYLVVVHHDGRDIPIKHTLDFRVAVSCASAVPFMRSCGGDTASCIRISMPAKRRQRTRVQINLCGEVVELHVRSPLHQSVHARDLHTPSPPPSPETLPRTPSDPELRDFMQCIFMPGTEFEMSTFC